MGSLVVRIVGAVGAAALLVMIFGSGVASAKDYYAGQTYDQAVENMSKYNFNPVIGAVNGGSLATGDCIVTTSHKSTFLNSSGRNDRGHDVVLNLNCNNRLAEPGHPGNSVMSKEGATAKKDQEAAANINKNPAVCDKSKDMAKWCEVVCKRSGLCGV
jgi:hypothetical protein